MREAELLAVFRAEAKRELPEPGRGATAQRHRALLEAGRRDLSLARLLEGHADAVAILAEAGRQAPAGATYGVWASERPGHTLRLDGAGDRLTVSGAKAFCSGAGMVDRALVTVGELLVDLDLKQHPEAVRFDYSEWRTTAFAATQTGTVVFDALPVAASDMIGGPGWYLQRPGFWHGACGPAACWAGGAIGLVDYALRQSRCDPHTMAHLGAMHAEAWGLAHHLEAAGREIDGAPGDAKQARVRARTVRHLVERAGTEVLRRFARAYGPQPLAGDEDAGRRYQELDLYLRQWHGERDLEALAADIRAAQG